MSHIPQPDPAQHRPTAPDSGFTCELTDISVSFGELDVLSEVNLRLNASEKLVIVGDNGSGKSTLLKVLAGLSAPNHGQRTLHTPAGMAYAAQNPVFAAQETVQQVIDSYHHRFRRLEELLETIGQRLQDATGENVERLLAQLQQVTDLYEAAEGYSLEQRVANALEQLGLGGLDRQREINTLSGGQRARLSLACVLCSGAELLLLDEPTNDLDENALLWLEHTLQTYQGALVVVSHDRVFLASFATTIVEISGGKLRRYPGDYRSYLNAKAKERADAVRAYELWEQEMHRVGTLVKKNADRVAAIPRKLEKAGFGHGSFRARSRTHGSTSKIRQAKSRIAELTADPVTRPAAELEFAIPQEKSVPLPGTALLNISDIRREQPPRLKLDELQISRAERWLISGPNGAGKSTLLRLLAGELAVPEGKIWRLPGLRVGWLRQDVAHPPAGTTLLEAFARATQSHLEQALEVLIELGLFVPQDLTRHPASLSVGQRRRLELSIALSMEADLLLLDEPTNHLAPALIEQLEDALGSYPGTVITVTHDRRWREQLLAQGQVHRLQVVEGTVKAQD